jgi:hypothetical protein
MRLADKPLESVLDKFELLDDFRPEQRHQVTGAAEMESRQQLLGHRRAAD